MCSSANLLLNGIVLLRAFLRKPEMKHLFGNALENTMQGIDHKTTGEIKWLM